LRPILYFYYFTLLMNHFFRFTSSFLLFLTFLMPLWGGAQPISKNFQSLLWEIKHPDNPSTVSYLYGTMHVSRKLAFNLSDTFFLGLQNADIIALESQPNDWLEEVMDLKYANEYFGGYPNYNRSSPGFYQRIFPINPPQNEELAAMISSRDLMINSLQYRSNPYTMDFEEDTYLDMFIHMSGSKLGKPVVGLENIAHTNDLHRLARSEIKTKKDEKPIPLWLEDMMKEQDLGYIFENSYRQQNLDLMMELLQLFQTDHYSRWFLEERNRLMVDSMMVLMRTKSVFAGVGAAHLAGNKGMITFLREKGCIVRPVVFLKTDHALEQKKYLDSITKPLVLTMQESPDGQFSMSLPSKLYELPYSGKHYLCSDMTNGSFVSIMKINTYSIMSTLTEKNYLDKIDSLLFENIPGNILSKKEIQNGPYKGVEIKNKTKTGNLQHYQIFVTPMEIICFKIGANGEFIKDWSDSMFSTLTFHPHPGKKTEWVRKKHVYGGFSVEVPEVHVFDNNHPISAIYNHPTLQAFDPKSDNLFMVTRNVLIDFFYLEEDRFELERTAEKLGKKHKMDVTQMKHVKHQGLPSLEFTLVDKEKKKKPVDFKMVINGGHYYLLAVKNIKDKSQKNRFFQSFRIEPFQNQMPFELFTDTFLYFQTMTSKNINESMVRLPSSIEKPKDYEVKNEVFVYRSETGESVRVYFNKFHQYQYYPDVDSIFKEDIKDITEDNSQFVIWQKRADRKDAYILDVLLGDTGTIRAIKLRIVVKKTGDSRYTLRTLVDTIHQTSPFIQAFYEHFTPFDSLLQNTVFKNKGNLFLDDVMSSDSIAFKRAMESLSYVWLDSTHTKRVIQLTEDPRLQTPEKEYLRHLILKEASYIKDDQLIPFASQLYFNHPNNYPIQMAALSIITRQGNQQAVDTLQSIMQKDLPFVMEEDKFIFSMSRFEEVKVWKAMYPGLYEFAHIQEYKKMIYENLIDMLDSGKIEGEFYSDFIPKIMNDAEFILKKQMASEQKKKLEKAKSEAVEVKKSTDGIGSKNKNLVDMYKLLLPHIQHQEVAELISSYDRFVTSEADILAMALERVKRKLDVNKQALHNMAKEPNMLLDLYTALHEAEALDFLSKSMIDNTLLARLTLNSSGSSSRSSSWNRATFDMKRDTFRLLSQEELKVKEKVYKVYTYRIHQFISKSDAEKSNFVAKDYQRLALIAVEMEVGFFNPNGTNFSTHVKIENPDRVDKYLEEMREEFIVRDRPRASAKEVGEGMYDYYDY